MALNMVGVVIAKFTESNPAEMLAAQLEDAATSSTQKLQNIGTNLLDLFDTFDGTPEMLDQISQAVDARYRGELEYLMAVDSLIKGIASSIAAQQQSIRDAIEGPRSPQELMREAMDIFAQLGSAGSPEALAQMVASIQQLVGASFSGRSAEEQAAAGGTLIAFLDQVQAAATERAEALAQMVVDEGTILREQALLFAETIGAPLDLNIAATDNVNASVTHQTDVINERGDMRDELLRELIREIRLGGNLAELRG